MIETQRAWLLWPCLCVHAEEKIDLFRNYTIFNVEYCRYNAWLKEVLKYILD